MEETLKTQREMVEIAPGRQVNRDYLGDIGVATAKSNNLSVPTAITSDLLTSSSTPVKLPVITPTLSPATEVIAGANANVQRQLTEQQAQMDAEKAYAPVKEAQSKRSGIVDSLSERFGLKKETQEQAIKDDTAIDPFRKELTDINKQVGDITVEYRGVQDQINARGDISQEAQRGLLLNAETKYGRVLADLAIRQSAANQNISQMEASADRKLKLATAPIDTEIEYLSKFALENADQLSKDEKEKINFMIGERDKAKKQIADEQNIANTALKTALENGVKVPDAVVQKILANPSQAYQILSSAGISLANPADQAKKWADAQKSLNDANSVAIGSNGSIYKKDASGNILKDENGKPVLDDSPKARALQIILGSGTFTKDQKATITNAINNGQDPFAVIKNQAKNTMGQTLATDLSKTETALSQLRSIDTLVDQYYTNGGTTGVFNGNYEKVVNKLGQVKDPKLVAIATELALAMQEYRLAVTGTAASVQEDARIDNVFPGISNSRGLNEARTNALLKSFEQKVDAGYKNVLGSSYDELKKAESTTFTPTQKANDPLDLGLESFNPLGI